MSSKGGFAGRVALVTGGSSGIGRAIGEALSAGGASVLLVGRNESALHETAARMREKGGAADYHACDLAQVAAIHDLVDVALARYKRLDILVNAAGIGFRAPLLGTRRTDILEAIDVNLRAPVLLTQAALPALLKAAPSEIVNVASIGGLYASAEASVYCATKFGLVGFSRALGMELEPARVRVTTVCPGPSDTPFFERYAPPVPAERMLSAGEIAERVVAALSDPPDILHGEIVFYRK